MENIINFFKNLSVTDYSRYWISRITIRGAFLVIILLSGAILYLTRESDDFIEIAKYIFASVIPIIATWVGTVLAFYFGAENFKMASEQMTRVLDKDLIDDIPVKNMMIALNTIVYKIIDDGDEKNHTIADCVKFLDSVRKDRLPIFSPNLIPRYIIHKSSFNAYLADKAEGIKETLTLEDFLEEEGKKTYSHKGSKGFIMAASNELLENLIDRIKNHDGCQDVFVSEKGEPNTKVLGWVTDSHINRYLTLDEKHIRQRIRTQRII